MDNVYDAPVGHIIQADDWTRDPKDILRWIHPSEAVVGRKVRPENIGHVRIDQGKLPVFERGVGRG